MVPVPETIKCPGLLSLYILDRRLKKRLDGVPAVCLYRSAGWLWWQTMARRGSLYNILWINQYVVLHLIHAICPDFQPFPLCSIIVPSSYSVTACSLAHSFSDIVTSIAMCPIHSLFLIKVYFQLWFSNPLNLLLSSLNCTAQSQNSLMERAVVFLSSASSWYVCSCGFCSFLLVFCTKRLKT